MERISYSLGSLLSIDEVLACAKKLEQIKPEVMWIPETWGMENFSMMATASRENNFSKIGSFLLSKKNKWITGQILHIDGGRSTLRIKA